MNSKAISIIKSRAVPLDIENVDTDQIIPARFLKALTREGFGKNLFRDWRYVDNDESKPKKDFVLNDPTYTGKILVAGRNFGCGSSREHAAWAIKDYGFDAVVSSFFADIFKNNALNNFIVPVRVSQPFLEEIFKAISENPEVELTIDIDGQKITLDGKGSESFEVGHYKKICLLNGYDDIDYLLSRQKNIRAFEETI